MDPDANLKDQLKTAREIIAIWNEADTDGNLTLSQQEICADKAEVLSDLVIALDEWLKKGGFPPKRWTD